MVDKYIKEFTAIVRYLLKDEKGRKSGDFLIVNKDTVIELLNRNAYETASNKLKVWKCLNWLDTDENRVTKRVTDNETKRRIPSLKINLTVYETLVSINGK